MLEEARAAVPTADVLIFAAAVADFRPSTRSAEKWKRSEAGPAPTISLAENPDVALETLPLRRKGAVAVGFALETGDLVQRAQAKLQAKEFDLIVANDPGEEGAGFEVATNRATILDREGGEEALPLLSKDEVALRVLDRVRERIARREGHRGAGSRT
jgi:phosphopantothenoylcysteine decarboxylase/phosphopantothenate--cysteine ligase